MDKFLKFIETLIEEGECEQKLNGGWVSSYVYGFYHLKAIHELFDKGELRIKPKTRIVEKGKVLYRTSYDTLCLTSIEMTKSKFEKCCPHEDFIAFLHPVEMVEEECDD